MMDMMTHILAVAVALLAAVCLKLCIEEVLWTLEGFFDGGASASRPGTPDS